MALVPVTFKILGMPNPRKLQSHFEWYKSVPLIANQWPIQLKDILYNRSCFECT